MLDMSSGWIVRFVSDEAEAEVVDLDTGQQAAFKRIAELIEVYGISRLREPYAKHLVGKLWELRLKGRSGIARSIYVTASDRRVIVLRTFVKKTRRTPPGELELAYRRARLAGFDT